MVPAVSVPVTVLHTRQSVTVASIVVQPIGGTIKLRIRSAGANFRGAPASIGPPVMVGVWFGNGRCMVVVPRAIPTGRTRVIGISNRKPTDKSLLSYARTCAVCTVL